jgi:hypothetical protein
MKDAFIAQSAALVLVFALSSGFHGSKMESSIPDSYPIGNPKSLPKNLISFCGVMCPSLPSHVSWTL